MIAFIVNSVADRGRCPRVMDELTAVLSARGVAFTATHTQAPGHAAALAREAALAGAETVVAVGGDGTVREVAEGLRASGLPTPMGIVPAGTGNDYRRCLAIPDDHLAALDIVLAGHTRAVDVGKVNDTLFVNIASVGFDVAVVEGAHSLRLGPLSYYASVFRTLLRFRGVEARVTADENAQSLRMLLCAVGVGTHYGGGMKVLPHSVPDDGLFDYCLVDSIPRTKIATLFPKFPSGGHTAYPFVHMGRCGTLTVERDEPFTVQADGDLLPNVTSARFTLLPAALRVLAPAEATR